MVGNRSLHEAVISRDEGLERLRRLTGVALALTVAGAGVFAGLAASSSNGRHAVRLSRGTRAGATPAGTVPAPAATVPVASSAPAAPSSPPSQAPQAAPPVVVSGGS